MNIDNTEHYLNEHGKLVWKHKTNKRLFLERAYHWVDSIIMIDETDGRAVVQSFKYSTYDFGVWEPMSKEEYDSVKSNYKEIYEFDLQRELTKALLKNIKEVDFNQ